MKQYKMWNFLYSFHGTLLICQYGYTLFIFVNYDTLALIFAMQKSIFTLLATECGGKDTMKG